MPDLNAMQHSHADVVRVLVGPDQREFIVHRKLLCASSAFFRDSIEAVPEALVPSSCVLPASSAAAVPSPMVIWLEGESAGMFELFVLWLYRRHGFRTVIDEAMTILAGDGHELVLLPPPAGQMATTGTSKAASTTAASSSASSAVHCCSELHWNLVQLHLFAALIDLPALQDVVMDALQDLYLRFDWEATPSFVRFLYAESDPFAAFRLRKWAVALMAWTLSNRGPLAGVGGVGSLGTLSAGTDGLDSDTDADLGPASDPDADPDAEETKLLRGLLVALPQLRDDYEAHLAKMAASKADARIKNPQLRIPSNHLRREDRLFGFRQCSFHSHRRSVGQSRCPHSSAKRRALRPKPASTLPSPAQSLPATPLSRPPPVPPHAVPAIPPLQSRLSSRPGAPSEPRLMDLPSWSPLSTTTPGMAPLGMESTI